MKENGIMNSGNWQHNKSEYKLRFSSKWTGFQSLFLHSSFLFNAHCSCGRSASAAAASSNSTQTRFAIFSSAHFTDSLSTSLSPRLTSTSSLCGVNCQLHYVHLVRNAKTKSITQRTQQETASTAVAAAQKPNRETCSKKNGQRKEARGEEAEKVCGENHSNGRTEAETTTMGFDFCRIGGRDVCVCSCKFAL